MLFKHSSLFLLLFALSFNCFAQDDYKLNLRVTDRNAYISSIHFNLRNLTVYIDPRGHALQRYDGGFNDYDDTPDDDEHDAHFDHSLPEMEYYDRFDYEELRGKIKSIAGVPITYYDRFDYKELQGKIKSIGNIKFTYYDRFDYDELRGKVKSVGGINLIYHDRFDYDELKGKLKQVGDTKIAYYDRFDGGFDKGRVKNVSGGTVNVIWRNRKN